MDAREYIIIVKEQMRVAGIENPEKYLPPVSQLEDIFAKEIAQADRNRIEQTATRAIALAENGMTEEMLRENRDKFTLTHHEFMKLSEEIFIKIQNTARQGQREYSHGMQEALGNFNRLAKDLNMPREKVLWIYLKKHLDGVLSHINGHRSQREPIDGRITDVIVYMCLFWGMVYEDRRNGLSGEVNNDS